LATKNLIDLTEHRLLIQSSYEVFIWDYFSDNLLERVYTGPGFTRATLVTPDECFLVSNCGERIKFHYMNGCHYYCDYQVPKNIEFNETAFFKYQNHMIEVVRMDD